MTDAATSGDPGTGTSGSPSRRPGSGAHDDSDGTNAPTFEERSPSCSDPRPPLEEGAPVQPAVEELLALQGREGGCYNVRTVTGDYLIDLDASQLVRTPCPVHSVQSPGRSLLWMFDFDGQWMPLIQLQICEVGSYMRATVLLEGQPQPLRSSPVQWIRPLTGESDRLS